MSSRVFLSGLKIVLISVRKPLTESRDEAQAGSAGVRVTSVQDDAALPTADSGQSRLPHSVAALVVAEMLILLTSVTFPKCPSLMKENL